MFGKNLDVTPTESLFLLVLYNHTSLSGSEIVKNVKEDLGEEWSPTPGATYKIIQKLIEKEYIHETTKTEKKNRDKRIRTYTLTPEGSKMVIKVITRMRKMIGFVESCCPDGEGVIIVKKAEPDNC
ncbi:MAG: PadR family transcriptional regulator [Candidatus Hodarchaeales archaeon]|jgi:DNA-binding PadR family transcriptional regulator